MKKAKTIKILKMDKKDNYGNTSFIIELDNGDKGFYTSKNEDQKKFVVGQESEYIIEEKTGAKGPYCKITIPQSEQFNGGGKQFGKQAQDPKIQMIGFAMSYTKDLVVAGKVELKEMPTHFEIIYNEMISKI